MSNHKGRAGKHKANEAQRHWQGGYGAAAAMHLVRITKAKQHALREARELMMDRIDSIAH